MTPLNELRKSLGLSPLRSHWFSGPVPPRGYSAKLQNCALPTPVAGGDHIPPPLPSHSVFDVFNLLTANKVAREFEFTPLRQRVFSFRDSLIICVKNAHLAGIRHSRSTGELVSSGFRREFWRFLSVCTLGGGLSL